jgi:hypothetical protein
MASVEDMVMCYSNIMLVHHKIWELWYNHYAYTSRPQVDKILQKSLTVLPKLTSLQVEDVVTFYKCLQEISMGYVLALVPFDAIVLPARFKRLCPPGLGLIQYAALCKAFMELLPWLILGSLSPQISGALASVCSESNNGYDYFWWVLAITVPRFDPTVPIEVPAWSHANNIFHFAESFLLYFHLQAKLNFHYDDCTRSGSFLCTIQFSEFADTVTTLQSQVNSYCEEVDVGYLPPNLRLHGLSSSLHQNTQARLRDNGILGAWHINSGLSLVQDVPAANRFARNDCSCGGILDRSDKQWDGSFCNQVRNKDDQRLGPSPQNCSINPRGPGCLA